MSAFDYNSSNSNSYNSNFPSGVPSNPQEKPIDTSKPLRPLPSMPTNSPLSNPELNSRVGEVGHESLVKPPLPPRPQKKIQAKKAEEALPKDNKIDVAALQEVDTLLQRLTPNFDDWDDLTHMLDDFSKAVTPLVEESKKAAVEDKQQFDASQTTSTQNHVEDPSKLEVSSEKATEEAVGQKDKQFEVPKTKSKIDFFASSLLRTVSQQGSSEYDNYVKSQLNYRGELSSEQTKQLQEKPAYQPDLQKASKYLPVTISVSRELLQRPFRIHKAAAEHALQKKGLYERVSDAVVSKVGILKAYGFNEKHELQPGKIVPSSSWLGGSSVEDQNHLMNLYVIRPSGEPALIRSSKIDSKETADEFITILKTVRDEIRKETGNDNYQLRVISEQFNSFERESSMIKGQHTWLSYANQTMRDEKIGELLHVNIPTNTFYFVSEGLKKFGIVGDFVKTHAINGEIKSKNMNLDSWGTYLRWIGEDLSVHASDADLKSLKTPDNKAVSDLLEGYLKKSNHLSRGIARNQKYCEVSLQKIQKFKDAKKSLKLAIKGGNFSEINKAQKELRSAYKERKSGIQELGAARKELRIRLEENHQHLAQLDSELDALSKTLDRDQNPALYDKLLTVRKPISLMKNVLGSQLEISTKASRGKELLMLQELSDQTGVTSCGNCRGGLDRTPIWHTAAITLKQMRQVDNTDTFQMTEQWDVVTKDINLRVKKMGAEAFAQWVADDAPVEGKNGQVIDKKVYREVIEFRKMMMDNLMTISLPITERSTGLQGFKWAPGGYKENRMPLNFLPSHVEINGKPVAMVRYGKKGQTLGLTVEGRQILTKFEGLRGS